MNRFVIFDNLPYLYDRGNTFAVRWDENGFTVGAPVELADVPADRFSEIEIKAQCREHLDSIGAAAEVPADNQEDEPAEVPTEAEIDALDWDELTVAELKAYAADKDIDLGKARTKADIIAVIKAAE